MFQDRDFLNTNNASMGPDAVASVEFIQNYLKQLQLPQIPINDLVLLPEPVMRSGHTADGLATKGSSANIALYQWMIPIELLESSKGDTTPDNQIIVTTYDIPPIFMVPIEVVVKAIRPQVCDIRMPMSQFLNELACLDHFFLEKKQDQSDTVPRSDPYKVLDPPIVGCYGYCYQYNAANDEHDDYQNTRLWIVMEKASRGYLSTEIIAQLSAVERMQAALDMCEGLYALHAKDRVHGDLKPENIFVDKHGRCKLGDFGCSFIGSEPFFLCSEGQYKSLKQKAMSAFTPAIVQTKGNTFHFVVKSGSMVFPSDLRPLPKIKKYLTEFECPEALREAVNTLFITIFTERSIPSKAEIAWGSPIMRFFETNGYCPETFEKIFRDNQCVGSIGFLASELYPSLYASSVLHPYVAKRPNFLTDIYSLGLVLYSLWAGKLPYSIESEDDTPRDLAKKIMTEELRPNCDKMYSEEGLVDISSLRPGHKTLEVKAWIEACWDVDPDKRPSLGTLIDFFRGCLHDFLVEAFTKNKEAQLKNILGILKNTPRFLIEPKAFKDHPYRETHQKESYKISLAHYALWSLSPCSSLILDRLSRAQRLLQEATLKASSWVKIYDENALNILKNLVKTYNTLEFLQQTTSPVIQSLRTVWQMIGKYQRELPTPLFFRYLALQKKEVCTKNDRLESVMNAEDALKTWYEPAMVLKSKKTGALCCYFEACYTTNINMINPQGSTISEGSNKNYQKILFRKKILNTDNTITANHATFPGLDLQSEKAVFEKILEETRGSAAHIQKSLYT